MQKSVFPIIMLLCLFCVWSIHAQTLRVESIGRDALDISASTGLRLDLNGTPCALVKVSLPLNGITFSGDVMGNVERNGSNYLVYMPKGTKRLWVNHPDFRELEVNLAASVGPLESKRTYRVDISIPEWYLIKQAAVSSQSSQSQSSVQSQTPASSQIAISPAESSTPSWNDVKIVGDENSTSYYDLMPSQDGKASVISGFVTEMTIDGEDIIGAVVTLFDENKNILEETVTDFDGHYSLPIPVGNDGLLLKFTYVGMKTQEIKYTGQTTLNVYMKPQNRKKEVK